MPNNRLKQRGLRPLDSQQVARRLGVRYTSRTVMRYFLALIFCIGFNTYACDTSEKPFVAFAVKQTDSPNGYLTFNILSPVKKGDFYLNGITAVVENEFIVALDIKADNEYVGDYYSSYFSIAEKHLDNVKVIMAYNATVLDRSVFAFCLNSAEYALKDLLSVEPVDKAPPPPPGSPDEYEN
jgi:hypothetical protein